MTVFRKLIFTACLIGCGTAGASDKFEAEIDQAERLGQEIYNQDIAAWVATDALLAELKTNSDFKAQKLKGWVSYKDGKTYRTIFVSRDVENPRVLFEAISKKRKVKSSAALTEPRPLTDAELGLWRARELTMKYEYDKCEDFPNINTVVIERADQPGYFGYLFASTKTPDLLVLGKHYRVEIDPAAETISNAHAFSKSCFALPTKTKNEDEKPVGLLASHIVTNYPQEHHVFANLMWGIDLYVTTPETGAMWQISDGQIKKTK